MTAILVLGFLLGMRHALEADHIAAVATLVARGQATRQAVFQGVAWGAGHTITLFLACSVVIFLDAVVPERLAQGLEAAVGAMLILLGADLIRRLWRNRVHFHTHRHVGGKTHFHAHSHAGESQPHTAQAHHHEHSFPIRALYVGLVHGLAGSAALILLALGSVVSPTVGLLYVGLFGIGSIGGMAVLSLVISVPMRSAQNFTWLYNGLQVAVAVATIVIGGILVYQNYSFTVV